MSEPNLRALNGHYTHANGLDFKATVMEDQNIVICLFHSDKTFCEPSIQDFLEYEKLGTIKKRL